MLFAVKYPSGSRKIKGIFFLLALFFVITGLVISLSGCADNDDAEKVNDHELIPLKKGWYQTYDVREIIYELGVPETLDYELKTVVIDSFPNPENGYTYVISRSKRFDGNEGWTADENWSVRLSQMEAIVTEASTPYVVLAFPARTGAQWNGNAYNDETNPNTNTGEDVYTIESSAQSCDVGTMSFDDCVKVLQEDNQDFIVYHDERRETYTRNVGLTFKETIQLHYCNDEDRNCIGQQIVDEGIIYTQTITGYGLE